MYSGGFKLSDRELRKLDAGIDGLGLSMMKLRAMSEEIGQLLFQVTPKAHMVCHLKSQARVINPRWVANYIEESMVGKVAAIWRGSANGPYRATVQRTTLLKYLTVWCMAMGL